MIFTFLKLRTNDFFGTNDFATAAKQAGVDRRNSSIDKKENTALQDPFELLW